MNVEHVPGKNIGSVMLYALSTCGWCRKTKELLNNMGIEYDYVFVDLLKGNEKDTIMQTVEKWNPGCTFPTLVINNNKCIVGYREEEIREAVET
jgi:glutaredoxin-like protein NrdH